jgi:hypothetical protein
MNKLDFTANGGIPLFLDDIRFLQDANRDAIKALISFLPNDKVVVLSGLSTPTPPNGFIEEGYVYWNGEVFFVPGIGDFASINHLLFDFTPTIDSLGDRQTATGDNISPHQIRTAKIIGFSTLPSPVPPNTVIFMQMGEVHPNTVGFYDAIAQRLDLVPPGVVMLWFGQPNTIPQGWEQATGQLGWFGGITQTNAPDLRRAYIVGFDAAASPPLNSVGTGQNGPDLDLLAGSATRRVVGMYIIKNGSNIPPLFTY